MNNHLQLLKPNQKVEVIINKNKVSDSYKTRVEEINPDGMVLAMPTSKGFPIILPSGELFVGKFIIDGCVYRFDAKYLDKRHNPIPVWLTTLPINLTKIQQRHYVRIETAIQVLVKFCQTDQPDSEVELNALTKDVSGGGVLLITKQPIPLAKQVLVTIALPDSNEKMVLSGQVIRSEQPKPEQHLYRVGVKFTNISEKQRSSIIRYVFKTQLERRNKGF